MPRLPRGLRAIEVARGRRYLDWPEHLATALLTAAELTPRARARLLARAEIRAQRLRASQRLRDKDWFWLAVELALVLPAIPPAVVRRWREAVRWGVYHARRDLDRLLKLEAAILAHEPETDQWLRRQLAGLTVPASGRPRPDRPEETGGTP